MAVMPGKKLSAQSELDKLAGAVAIADARHESALRRLATVIESDTEQDFLDQWDKCDERFKALQDAERALLAYVKS